MGWSAGHNCQCGWRRGATPDTPKVATLVNDVGIQCTPNTSDSSTHAIFSDITLDRALDD